MKRFWARLPITDMVSGGERWHYIVNHTASLPSYETRCGRTFKVQALEHSAERPNVVRNVCQTCDRAAIADRRGPDNTTEKRAAVNKALKRNS
jgi:hypothetical protein